MISIIINDQKFEVPENLTVLEAAREHNIHVPTLCYHEAILPVGACRLCIVEVEQNGRTRTAASCVTPVADNMIVRTNTEKIIRMRRVLVELLLARCPNLPVLQNLAKEVGLKTVRFKKEAEDCFLCGLCVRACSEIVGVNAIGFGDRGVNNKIEPPFLKASSACISCGTCTTICPAGTFHLERVDRLTSLHHFAEDYRAEKCRICGEHFM
ncbi:MAG: 2Fe-2S iron-sulfur cluster-binding protein [Candidatus Zhuqueibacterota bacterium]